VVVEGEVVLDAGAQFGDGHERVSVEVLVLEDRPEALGARVVVATAGRTHRANDLELGAQPLGRVVTALTAAVRVKDRAGDGGRYRFRCVPQAMASFNSPDLDINVIAKQDLVMALREMKALRHLLFA
jgi:hypothetical protein